MLLKKLYEFLFEHKEAAPEEKRKDDQGSSMIQIVQNLRAVLKSGDERIPIYNT
jgi:hypothetical protein